MFQINKQDPVWTVSLPQLLAAQLEISLNTLGMAHYRLLVSDVDVVIREQMADFLPPDRVNILLVFDA